MALRRSGTVLVVGAVAAVAAAAVVDAVRPDGPRAPSAVPVARAAATLDAAGVSGALTYADARCRVHVVALPALRDDVLSGVRSCAFAASPGGTVSFDGGPLAPGGQTWARCRGRVVDVGDGERVRRRLPGCAPAWRGDGTLTLVRAGEVVSGEPCARAPCDPLVSYAALRAAYADTRWRDDPLEVVRLAWLDDETVAAVVRAGGERVVDTVALFRRGRRVARPSGRYDRLSALRASPRGRWVAATAEGASPGVVVFDRRGRLVGFLPRATAVAWSPDERALAVARLGRPAAVRPGPPAGEPIELPFEARDVFWQ